MLRVIAPKLTSADPAPADPLYGFLAEHFKKHARDLARRVHEKHSLPLGRFSWVNVSIDRGHYHDDGTNAGGRAMPTDQGYHLNLSIGFSWWENVWSRGLTVVDDTIILDVLVADRDHIAACLDWEVHDGRRGGIWGEFVYRRLAFSPEGVPTLYERTIGPDPYRGASWLVQIRSDDVAAALVQAAEGTGEVPELGRPRPTTDAEIRHLRGKSTEADRLAGIDPG